MVFMKRIVYEKDFYWNEDYRKLIRKDQWERLTRERRPFCLLEKGTVLFSTLQPGCADLDLPLLSL